jgi:hypothetical protein
MSRWMVITTIYPPREKFLEVLNSGWKIVVVGDKSTPHREWEDLSSSSLFYLSPESQVILFPELSELIGWKTYARKNLGYLFAVAQGATEIWDTDDDTFIRSGAKVILEDLTTATHFEVEGRGVFNPYNEFAKGMGLWPRGYPLREIGKDRFNHNPSIVLKSTQPSDPDILQTLVNLEPDLDSIYRLTIGDDEVDLGISNSVLHIKKPLVVPGNTQSTLWRNIRKFEFLYIPSSVSFRFCDILKMYVAQSSCKIAYAGFLSEQFRNPHDYFHDFQSEVECFLATDTILEMLKSEFFEKPSEFYAKLVEKGICLPNELLMVRQFEETMRSLCRQKP